MKQHFDKLVKEGAESCKPSRLELVFCHVQMNSLATSVSGFNVGVVNVASCKPANRIPANVEMGIPPSFPLVQVREEKKRKLPLHLNSCL